MRFEEFNAMMADAFEGSIAHSFAINNALVNADPGFLRNVYTYNALAMLEPDRFPDWIEWRGKDSKGFVALPNPFREKGSPFGKKAAKPAANGGSPKKPKKKTAAPKPAA